MDKEQQGLKHNLRTCARIQMWDHSCGMCLTLPASAKQIHIALFLKILFLSSATFFSMEIQQHTNAALVHPDLAIYLNLVRVFSWSENLFHKSNKVKNYWKNLFFSPECQLFLCWTGISTLLVLHFFERNVLRKQLKKTIWPMLVCSKLQLFFDSFCLRSIFGAFVGVKAGSDTWHWCYIINTTCDQICRAQHSSAKTPQSSLASYWSESDVLCA